jgi:hypothetical protein
MEILIINIILIAILISYGFMKLILYVTDNKNIKVYQCAYINMILSTIPLIYLIYNNTITLVLFCISIFLILVNSFTIFLKSLK